MNLVQNIGDASVQFNFPKIILRIWFVAYYSQGILETKSDKPHKITDHIGDHLVTDFGIFNICWISTNTTEWLKLWFWWGGQLQMNEVFGSRFIISPERGCH